jgi:hypothetical protein
MKKWIVISGLVFGVSVVAGTLFVREVNLKNGENVQIGDTRVTCGDQGNSGNGSSSGDSVVINGQRMLVGLSGQVGYVMNTATGEKFTLGCCVTKVPKVIMAANTPVFLGVGTDHRLYYQSGLRTNGNWLPTNGTLIGEDDFAYLRIKSGALIFGRGTDSRFYMAEFQSDGHLAPGDWVYINGNGPRIIAVYPNGDNDYRLVVDGSDGRQYTRTRTTDFVPL